MGQESEKPVIDKPWCQLASCRQTTISNRPEPRDNRRSAAGARLACRVDGDERFSLGYARGNAGFSLDFAVGTRLTPSPPHRSVRARLSHTAPVLGSDGITFEGQGMVGDWQWKPLVDKAIHALPRDTGSLASPLENGFPDSTQVLSKDLERR